MSHDLLFKKPGHRNWARGNPSLATGTGIAGPLPTPVKKIARGTIVLGTLAGLAFITSPWWKPMPRQPDLRHDPMRQRMSRSPGAAPSSRVVWSRR